MYIGRFGRKASAIDLLHQAVNAYKEDMGITSDFDMDDPINYASSVIGDDNIPDPEVPSSTVQKVVFYLQTLEAPRRRNVEDLDVIQGEIIFDQIGCASCHKAKLSTGYSEIAALNEVDFYPYTDMLMHDMGSALNDNYTEGLAETFEWRTIPLWGLGLQEQSQGGVMYLLHDGRATSYEEAIDYHGGEAAMSRDGYKLLPQEDKARLEKFLNSL